MSATMRTGVVGGNADPGALRIGEVADRTGVPTKTIRFYEQVGLIAPAARTRNGYRTYGENDVKTLRFIQRARSLGFSLPEVNELLTLYRDRRRASREVKRLALAQVATLDRRIAELSAMRGTLAELARHCQGDARPDCPILEDLEAPPQAGAAAQSERPLR